ncbi:MAG: pectate lyase [Vicinamibacterales bacterium]
MTANRFSILILVLTGCTLLQAQAVTSSVRWADVLDQAEAWYAGADARRVADSVLRYQRSSGGWPKNIDMTVPPTEERPAADATIDNGATTTQIRLLARVFQATAEPRYRDAARRGIDYLLEAQYAHGGWPQVYPLRKGYSRYVTFNDNAMINVMTVLDDIAGDAPAYAFADAGTRARSRAAIEKGLDVILRAQVRVGGRLTVWCAQHDEITLEPRGARTYEHPSLSAMESVGIVRFLMHRGTGADRRIAPAVEAAIAWLTEVKLIGWRLEQRSDPTTPRGWDRVMVRDPSAPPLWARFHEIGSNRPMFSGRDGIVRYRLDEIEYERRIGYAWVGDWPRSLLKRDYPAWRSALR